MSTTDRETAPFLLLRTKFQRPRLRENLVSRPRLLDQLNTGLRPSGLSEIDRKGNGSEASTYGEGFSFAHKLILISAPAGYGKTTVLGQWLDDCPCPSAWLSLDAEDSDPRVFLTYLIGAIQSVYPGACRSTSSLLRSHQLPPQDYLASLLTNELVDLPDKLVLALDDFHRIDGESVPKLTAALLDHLPSQVCLAIATRQDPNLPLMRLRANGEMSELRMADLSFTYSEAQVFLEQTIGKSLSNELVEALEKRTEGWIVGLRLAAMSLRSAEDPSDFVKSFQAGGHRFVMEYLVDEVLSLQPPAVRSFLFKTSILERFCAPLCDAVLDQGDSWVIIEELDRTKLFLVSLDIEGKWYRYHHLFQELLAHRLHAGTSSNEIRSLHMRASAWFIEYELVEEAITHALKAGEILNASRLVENNYRHAVNQGQWARLRRWMDLLPDDIITQRPGLLLAHCWCLHREFKLAETVPIFMSAEELLEAPNPTPGFDLHDKERRYLLGEINGLRSQALYFLGDFEHGLAFAEKSLEQLQESFSYGQSGAVLYWALHCHVLGRGKEAVDRLHQVIRAEPEDSPFTMHLHNGLCYIYRSLADFPRLSLAAHDYLRAAQKANLPESVAFAHYQLGVLHYEWNELDLAQYHFGEATNLRYFAHELSYQSSLQGLTLVYLALGLNDKARETIAATHEFADQTGSDLLQASSCSFQARLSLFEGNLEKAGHESLSVQGGSQVETMLLFEVPALTRAKVLYARATPESLKRAMTLLDKLFAQAKKNHFAWRQVEILALQGMVLAAQNRIVEALSHLEQSVLLARPGWLVRTFVDLGSPLDDLLRQLTDRGIAPEYLTHVLAAFDSEVKTSSPDHGSSITSFEPLTERELEVLALINQRLTNREIAQRLVISPKTVKRHASNIYEKLGVGNRRQAAARARALQILPSPKVTS